jgi:hypothetical protein
MSLVAATLTPLASDQAMGAIQAALPIGTSVGQAGLALIAAQSATETGWWAAMYNWNFGNVTPTPTQQTTGDYFQHANTGSMMYRSFPDPISGAKAMLDWLSSHGALAAAEAGDLDGYMAALQAGSYLGTIGLTDGSGHTVTQSDYDTYRANIASISAQLMLVTPISPPLGWHRFVLPTALAAVGAAVMWQHERLLGFAMSVWKRFHS